MKATSSFVPFDIWSVAHRLGGRTVLPALAILVGAMLCTGRDAAASAISLFSTGSSSMPFTVTGTVFDVPTGQAGTLEYTGVFIQEYLSSSSDQDDYRVTTTATYLRNISPAVANSVVNSIWDKILRDFGPKPPRPPVPPVPAPTRPKETIASITSDDFQLECDVTGSALTMSGTVTATPTLWTFGFDAQLLQPLPDFTGDVVVGMDADGLLERVDPPPGKLSGGSGKFGGGGSPWLFSGSSPPTLNATETVALTLTPIGGAPLDLTLDVKAYWSLDYGALPYASERILVSSTLTNTATTWFSTGMTYGTSVPEIDPVSLGGTLGVVASFLALLEGRQRRHRPRSWGSSLGVGSPVAELAAQPGLREPEPALGRLT